MPSLSFSLSHNTYSCPPDACYNFRHHPVLQVALPVKRSGEKAKICRSGWFAAIKGTGLLASSEQRARSVGSWHCPKPGNMFSPEGCEGGFVCAGVTTGTMAPEK